MKRILLICILYFTCFGQAVAQDPIPIWDGYDVDYGDQVTLTPYVPESNETGVAVIICPGGSYCWLDQDNENFIAAEWLKENHITAFVLRYRTIGFFAYLWHYRCIFRGKQYPDMITDAQRAIQWVREHAEEYHIDPNRVGMMGFSAGGHLVMSTACFNETNYLEDIGVETQSDLRPAFVAPIYPVVTMRSPYVHRRSRRALLSEKRHHDQTMIDSLSLECHIPSNCPPVFLVNCIDDPVVEYYNSVLLDSALTANQIEHRYIQYKTGGHGFGAGEEKGTPECHQWKTEFINWIKLLYSYEKDE